MERIKEEIVSNADKLQLEVHEITLRLNSIVQQNQKTGKDIKLLKYKELLEKKDHYLSIMHQQHCTIQILLSVNLQLEELQNSNKLTLKNAATNGCASNAKPREHERLATRKNGPTNRPPDHVEVNSTVSDSSLTVSSSTDDIIDTARSGNERAQESARAIDPSVLTKLKQYDLLSTKRKYINSLKRPVIPDLSFKKVAVPIVNRPGANQNRAAAEVKHSGKPCGTPNDVSEESRLMTHGRESNGFAGCAEVKGASEVAKRTLAEVSPKEDVGNEIFEGNLPQPPELHVNVHCLISHIKSPSEFYVTVADETMEKIESISSDYAGRHDSPESPFLSKAEAKRGLRAFCLFYVEAEQMWCRARVVDWREAAGDAEAVTVYLVDYGCTLDSTHRNLRPLPAKYAEVPQCAIKCRMAYLFPPGCSDENQTETWPDESVSAFKSIVGIENCCTHKVVYVENVSNCWIIDLMKLTDGEDDPSVGQRLIDAKTCVEVIQPFGGATDDNDSFIKAQIETAQGLYGISPDMSDNEKLDTFCKNTDAKEATCLDEALTSYKANDEARTCQVFRRYGTCYKLPNCKFEHTRLREDGYTTDKYEAHITTTLPLNLPTVGQTVDVRITSISNLTLWYGHITSNIPTYAQLIESLNEPKRARHYKPLTVLPSLGELIVVKSQTNGQWCRGQVKEVYQTQVSPEETVHVFLVDTGDTIEARLSELRAITSELLYVPFQAVLLKLHGLREKRFGELDAVAYCEGSYLSNVYEAVVLHASPPTLVVTLTKRDVDIRTRIAEDGYGEIVDDEPYPVETFPLSFD